MCDERTQHDTDTFLSRLGITRRQFGKLSVAAGVAAMFPPVANAQDVTEIDVEVTTPDGIADCYFVHPGEDGYEWQDCLDFVSDDFDIFVKFSETKINV